MTKFPSWHYAFLTYGIAFGILPPVTQLYFTSSLKGSLLDYGVMSALATLFSIVISIYGGRLPERYGRTKPFIVSSFIFSGMSLFALSQTTEIWLFQILYILLEGSNALHVPSTHLLIAETYQRADWSKMFAEHSLIVGFAGTVGLALCSVLVTNIGYGSLLMICVPLIFASFFLALVTIQDPPLYVERWLSRISRTIDDVESLSHWLSSKSSIKHFKLKPTVNLPLFNIGTFIFTLAASSAFGSLSVFLSTVMAPSIIFCVFMFRSLFGTLSYVVVDRWLNTWRNGNAIKCASLARAILVLPLPCIALSPWLAPLLAMIVLSGVAFSRSLYSIDSNTIVLDYASVGSIGTYEALKRFGIIFGGFLSGVIPSILGFTSLFTLASALFMISFTIFWTSIS